MTSPRLRRCRRRSSSRLRVISTDLATWWTAPVSRVAAPVIVIDRATPAAASSASIFSRLPGTGRARTAWPSFASPQPTPAGAPPAFRVETLFSVLRPGEPPQITVHLQQAQPGIGEVRVKLLSADKVLEASHSASRGQGAIPDFTVALSEAAGRPASTRSAPPFASKDSFESFTKMVSG